MISSQPHTWPYYDLKKNQTQIANTIAKLIRTKLIIYVPKIPYFAYIFLTRLATVTTITNVHYLGKAVSLTAEDKYL